MNILNKKKVNITKEEEEENIEEINSINIEEVILNTTISSNKNKNSTIEFILDLGATIYTYCNRELFNSIISTNTTIK